MGYKAELGAGPPSPSTTALSHSLQSSNPPARRLGTTARSSMWRERRGGGRWWKPTSRCGPAQPGLQPAVQGGEHMGRLPWLQPGSPASRQGLRYALDHCWTAPTCHSYLSTHPPTFTHAHTHHTTPSTRPHRHCHALTHRQPHNPQPPVTPPAPAGPALGAGVLLPWSGLLELVLPLPLRTHGLGWVCQKDRAGVPPSLSRHAMLPHRQSLGACCQQEVLSLHH